MIKKKQYLRQSSHVVSAKAQGKAQQEAAKDCANQTALPSQHDNEQDRQKDVLPHFRMNHVDRRHNASRKARKGAADAQGHEIDPVRVHPLQRKRRPA